MVKYKSKKSLFISFDSHFVSWYKINVILILKNEKHYMIFHTASLKILSKTHLISFYTIGDKIIHEIK